MFINCIINHHSSITSTHIIKTEINKVRPLMDSTLLFSFIIGYFIFNREKNYQKQYNRWYNNYDRNNCILKIKIKMKIKENIFS